MNRIYSIELWDTENMSKEILELISKSTINKVIFMVD